MPERRSSPARRFLGRVLIGLGGLAAVAGLAGIGGYVMRAIDVLGQSDRSWLFWGLSVLVGGVMLLLVGISLVVVGRELAGTAGGDGGPGSVEGDERGFPAD